jgi:hypothetical protein
MTEDLAYLHVLPLNQPPKISKMLLAIVLQGLLRLRLPAGSGCLRIKTLSAVRSRSRVYCFPSVLDTAYDRLANQPSATAATRRR